MKKSLILILLLATCFVQCSKDDSGEAVQSRYYGFYDQDYKWGYIDQYGKVVIEPQWDMAYDTYLGWGIVAKDSKWGLIDEKGKEVIPLQYERVGLPNSDVTSMVNEKFIIAAKKDGKSGYIDLNNNILCPFIYSYTGSLINGLAPVCDFNGKWGYVNDNAEVVIPLIYDGFGFFYEDKCWVGKRIDGAMKWGVINKSGTEIIPFIYDLKTTTTYNTNKFSGGISCFRINEVGAGFIDGQGNQLFGKVWEGTGVFSEGLAAVRKNNLVGYIDTKGNEVIPCQFATGGAFTGGITGFKQTNEGLWGIIKKDGTVLLSPQFTTVTQTIGYLYAVTFPDEALGYINNKGEIVWRGSRPFVK